MTFTRFKEPGFKEPGFKESRFKESGFKEVRLKRPLKHYLSLMLLPLILLGMISGCQFTPTTDKGNEEGVSEEALTVATTTPNPYLANRPRVPAEARARFQLANEALAASQWQTAEQHLLWLTQHHATLSGPWINLALVYAELKQIDKVTPAFEQAITANNHNIHAYNQYAIFLREQGSFSDAEKMYQRALAIWPDYPEGHLNLAILYDLYMGQLAPAVENYLAYQALQEEPDRQVEGWIVDAQRRLNRQQPSEVGEPQ